MRADIQVFYGYSLIGVDRALSFVLSICQIR